MSSALIATPIKAADDSTRPIRLMVVDDSIVARSIYRHLLDGQPQFAMVAMAGGIDEALALLARTSVDIILLDIEMPGTDGLTGLPRLIEVGRGARILVLSSACTENCARTVQALAQGAADTLQKPVANRFGEPFAKLLADRLMRIGRASAPVRISTGGLPATTTPAPLISLRKAPDGPVSCIAIGASTGGLHALAALFKALPPSVSVPILVTQHLPAAFMPYFAAQLRDIAGRPAKVVTTGDRVEGAGIFVAPGDAHLSLVRANASVHVQLDRAPSPSGCLPSVDPMLTAVAAIFGPAGVGIILTGMGRDGARGATTLADDGGEVLVQDAATSVIWGMPGAAAAAGAASAVLPPAAIAERIAKRIVHAGQSRWS